MTQKCINLTPYFFDEQNSNVIYIYHEKLENLNKNQKPSAVNDNRQKNTILLYISQKYCFSKLLYFHSGNSLKAYKVLVSLKNILIVEILKYSTIYMAYQT